MSDGVQSLEFVEDGDEHEEHDNHDPHIWGDVQNAIIAVTNIADALSTADPDNATIYGANSADYLTNIQNVR